MNALRTLQIRISGEPDQQPLKLERLDIDELIKALEHSKDLIAPDSKARPDIHVQIKEGSILFQFTTAAKLIISVQALLAEVQKTYNTSILAPKQVNALSFFSHLAQKEKFDIAFGDTQGEPALRIDQHTSWEETAEEIWVDTERYIKGKITSLGGKTQPNIHMETEDPQLGLLIVNASEDLLTADRKNRLYKQQELRIHIRQNVASGAYDLKSAVLLEFIDHPVTDESASEYLDRLIEEATPHWQSAGDPDTWLKSVRGYE